MKTKVMLSALIFLLVCCVSVPSSFALPVTINNADFELSNGVKYESSKYGVWYHGDITGWNATGSASFGIWAPISTTETQLATGSENGSYVGYLANGSIYQQLDWDVAENAVYTLGIDIGNRNDLTFPEYSIALYAGDDELVSWANAIVPTEGIFQSLVLEYALTSEDYLNFGGEQLSLVITALNANQLNFDNLTLSNDIIDTPATAPVPEPATLLLLGVGIIGLVGFGRRRNAKKN